MKNKVGVSEKTKDTVDLNVLKGFKPVESINDVD